MSAMTNIEPRIICDTKGHSITYICTLCNDTLNLCTRYNPLWGLFILFFVLVCNGEPLHKKRVCVIGAGRAGLAAIKLVVDQIDNFELVAVERNSDIGGLWIYRDDPCKDEHGIDVHSGIYKHLRTNFPIDFMVYPDYASGISSAFVSHEVFLQYMRNYTDHFRLRKHIQFDTLVTKIFPVECHGHGRKKTTWRMEMQNLNTGKMNKTNCDGVMVCNGHFSKPYMPAIAGLRETFPGQVLHSRNYRTPEIFINKTVVIMGAGNSGVDIAIDLGNYTKKTYLSHRHNGITDSRELPSNVQIVPSVVSVKGNKLTLQDNSTIAVDTFIYCTGYSFDFPFLDNRSGIVYDRKHIRPLHNQFINVENPSMAFVGLATAIDYSTQYYSQSTYFLEVLKGKQALPSYEEMLKNSKSIENLVG